MAAPRCLPALEGLLGRLTTFAVDWNQDVGETPLKDEPDYEPGIDREEADLDKANVVSSLLRPATFFDDVNDGRHVVAIDLDIPAYLVPSSTEGHSHLYIDVPDGIPHHRYMALLSALADCGIIETGYAAVSQTRGHSDLRLPWVEKGAPTPPMPQREAAKAAEPDQDDDDDLDALLGRVLDEQPQPAMKFAQTLDLPSYMLD